MNIDEYKERTDLSGITYPLFFLEFQESERITGSFLETTGPLIHGRVKDERGMEENLGNDGDVGEFFLVERRERNALRYRDNGDVGPCSNLSVNPRMTIGDVLLDISIGTTY